LKFTETNVAGAWQIDLSPIGDERGFFARTWCVDEFHEHGINTNWVQANMSYSEHAGTLRGLHLQTDPAPEAKLVRCVKGALFDVIVDLRPESPTFLKHVGIELTAENRRAVYVPPYCAHGFQMLEAGTEVNYLVSGKYTPEAEHGYRYDDPAFGISWPMEVTDLSEKDQSWEWFDKA